MSNHVQHVIKIFPGSPLLIYIRQRVGGEPRLTTLRGLHCTRGVTALEGVPTARYWPLTIQLVRVREDDIADGECLLGIPNFLDEEGLTQLVHHVPLAKRLALASAHQGLPGKVVWLIKLSHMTRSHDHSQALTV